MGALGECSSQLLVQKIDRSERICLFNQRTAQQIRRNLIICGLMNDKPKLVTGCVVDFWNLLGYNEAFLGGHRG